MVKYKNLSGNSSVSHYLASSESINVYNSDGSAYKFDTRKPGRQHVDEMKRLAKEGSGLSTYIQEHVGKNFSQKIK